MDGIWTDIWHCVSIENTKAKVFDPDVTVLLKPEQKLAPILSGSGTMLIIIYTHI